MLSSSVTTSGASLTTSKENVNLCLTAWEALSFICGVGSLVTSVEAAFSSLPTSIMSGSGVAEVILICTGEQVQELSECWGLGSPPCGTWRVAAPVLIKACSSSSMEGRCCFSVVSLDTSTRVGPEVLRSFSSEISRLAQQVDWP
jgi:hypothetical protein